MRFSICGLSASRASLYHEFNKGEVESEYWNKLTKAYKIWSGYFN